jgi:hypothetical protein
VGSGARCATCSLAGTSAVEIRLRFELVALGVPVDPAHPPVVVVGRRPVRADIVIPDWGVVVEYDGEYWHRYSEESDSIRTRSLVDAGWNVVRLRCGALPQLSAGESHVAVGNSDTVVELAVAA